MLFTESFLRKLERLSVMSRRSMSGQSQGERRSTKRGQSVEFADFRPYSPGDDFRRIDWNAYARLERFFLKLFVEEEDQIVHILVDTSRSMNWGQPNKLEYSLKAAGALGYIAFAGLDQVTVTAFGAVNPKNDKTGYFPPHRGKRSANALFTFLENYLPENSFAPSLNHHPASSPSISFAPSLQQYATRSVSTGPLILISDCFESSSINQPNTQSGINTSLNSLAAKGFDITLLHTLSPDEVNPDLSGDLKLLDSENDGEVEITADYDLLNRYHNELMSWQAELRSFCGARGVNYLPIETTLPLEELLFAWMRQYSVIK